MTVTKAELEKIFEQYHNQDVMGDKFIEDACQNYTFNWVFRMIEGCRSVLELGYGEGHFTSELVKRGFDVTIVDGSASLLKKAKQIYGDQLQYEHELFEQFSPTRKFDCILATHVLEHVDDPVDLLKKMKGWLSANGKIVVIVPNKESIHRQLAVLMGLQPELDTLSPRDKLVGHQRVYSLESLAKDICAAHFEVKESTGFFLKALPNSMMLSYSPDLIRALNEVSPQIPKHLLANIGVMAQ